MFNNGRQSKQSFESPEEKATHVHRGCGLRRFFFHVSQFLFPTLFIRMQPSPTHINICIEVGMSKSTFHLEPSHAIFIRPSKTRKGCGY